MAIQFTVRFACELVRNGRIGKVKRIVAEVSENNFKGPGPGWKPMPVPEGFDYDMWLGPAPSAVSQGSLSLSLPFHYGLFGRANDELRGTFARHRAVGPWHRQYRPIEFEDLPSEWPEPGDLFTTPNKVHFLARYADDIEVELQNHAARSSRLVSRATRAGWSFLVMD